MWGENLPKIQGGPQHDQFRKLSSAMDPASHGTKIVPLSPLGGGKIGGQIFKFDQKFLEKGGSPTPKILHHWKAIIERYKVSQCGVSRPRNEKMQAL